MTLLPEHLTSHDPFLTVSSFPLQPYHELSFSLVPSSHPKINNPKVSPVWTFSDKALTSGLTVLASALPLQPTEERTLSVACIREGQGFFSHCRWGNYHRGGWSKPNSSMVWRARPKVSENHSKTRASAYLKFSGRPHSLDRLSRRFNNRFF